MKKQPFRTDKFGTLLVYESEELVGIINVAPGDIVILEDCFNYVFEENNFFSNQPLSCFAM